MGSTVWRLLGYSDTGFVVGGHKALNLSPG